MILNVRVLSTAAAVAITFAVSAAAYYYKSRNTEINEVMVFCKLQYNTHNYFDKLISYVEAAKETVNICMPSIHNPAIHSRLVSLIKKKKIKVRMIIDRTGYNESTYFFIKELIEAGAEIRSKGDQPIYHRMQHKFCLVDDKVLMTGTLDWGNDRSADHWNYVYITSKPQLVLPVKREFYKLWDEYSSNLVFSSPHSSSVSDSSDSSSDSDIEIIHNGETEHEGSVRLRETSMTPEVILI